MGYGRGRAEASIGDCLTAVPVIVLCGPRSRCLLKGAVLGRENFHIWRNPMSENLTTSVRREFDRLKKEIGQRTSQLASLKDDLRRHQKVYGLLRGADRTARRPKRPRRRARRTAPVNWNSVLNQLPSRFTLSDIAKGNEAKGKAPVYLRQIAVRWAKQGKTKRVGRGRYQKVEPRKSRARVTPQRKK